MLRRVGREARARRWVALYALLLLLYFSASRAANLSMMFALFAADGQRDAATTAAVLALGVAEDALVLALLLVLLSLADVAAGPRSAWAESSARPTDPASPARRARALGCQWRPLVRLLLHTVLVASAVGPFGADLLLLRVRDMRFTFQFLGLYFREIDFDAGFVVDPHEVAVAKLSAAVAVATVALLLVIGLAYCDFSCWHLATLCGATEPSERDAVVVAGGKTETSGATDSSSSDDAADGLDEVRLDVVEPTASAKPVSSTTRSLYLRRIVAVCIPLAILCLGSSALLVVTQLVPAVVSASALNNSLNELFRLTLDVQFLKNAGDGTIESAAVYLPTGTEEYKLFKDDVLFRTTTGFKGPLAFDVAVNASDPPNVLVLAVESFRYQDSLYIVGNKSSALLERQRNVTLTPNFDRWAQRGVTFRNFWSGWQTSRSVESILFGQVPYDHVTDTGTSTGRADVALHGMPQLFAQKGYETIFTSGSRIAYDQWDQFMPSHGFEHVLGMHEFMARAEQNYGVQPGDWASVADGGKGRKFGWGVHDDLSFAILGDLLVARREDQAKRLQQGKPKTPFFLNHYTISSHTPFEDSPAWFAAEELPDFEPLYRGQPHADVVKKYARLRYFTDVELGKFLDRMKKAGVLDDTIVVIVGDHGQSPENGLTKVDVDQIATTRVAATLLAEGRLGKSAGLVLDDAAEQHDLLNTLADIVGVPDGGFLQSGVGRSLKRAVASGQRPPVWANNPQRQLAAVSGHQRLVYDRVFQTMHLYDAESDPNELRDLFDAQSREQKRVLRTLAAAGRRLSRYFRVRWDNKCISQVECP